MRRDGEETLRPSGCGLSSFSLLLNPYSPRSIVKNLNEHVRVPCRDYVQEETNYDIERFDGRFGVSGLDCGPISWSNYQRLFPPPEPVCFQQRLFSSVFTVRDDS